MQDLVHLPGFADADPHVDALRYLADGRLLLIQDEWLQILSERGTIERAWSLGQRHWAAVTSTHEGLYCLAANAATGEVVKVSLSSGQIVARYEGLASEAHRAATGVVEYWST